MSDSDPIRATGKKDVVCPPTRELWVWYSWSEKHGKWFRSCWKGDTKEQAVASRQSPLAVELESYENILVKEVTTFTPQPTPAASEESGGDEHIWKAGIPILDSNNVQVEADLRAKIASLEAELWEAKAKWDSVLESPIAPVNMRIRAERDQVRSDLARVTKERDWLLEAIDNTCCMPAAVKRQFYKLRAALNSQNLT